MIRKNIILCSLIICLTFNGCAVVKASRGTTKDLSLLSIGSQRSDIIKKYGKPVTSVVKKDGWKIETYLVYKGKDASLARAGGNLLMDIFTFGFWEIGDIERGEPIQYTITFDKADRVEDLDASPIYPVVTNNAAMAAGAAHAHQMSIQNNISPVRPHI